MSVLLLRDVKSPSVFYKYKTEQTHRHLGYYVHKHYIIFLALFFQNQTLWSVLGTVMLHELFVVWLKIVENRKINHMNALYVHIKQYVLNNIITVHHKFYYDLSLTLRTTKMSHQSSKNSILLYFYSYFINTVNVENSYHIIIRKNNQHYEHDTPRFFPLTC